MATTSAEQPQQPSLQQQQQLQQQTPAPAVAGPHAPCPAAAGSAMVSWLASTTEAQTAAAEAKPRQSEPDTLDRVSTASTAEDESSQASSSELGADLEEGRLDGSSLGSTSEQSNVSGCDEAAAAKGHSRRRCSRKGCCACSSLCALGIAVLLVARTVGKPVWQLRSLVVQPDVMSGLVQVFTDPHFNSSITVPIDAEVDVRNSHLVGAQAGAGHFTVFSGNHVLAQVTTEPVRVRARGHSTVRARSTSTITPETSKYLMSVLPPAFRIRPRVVGEVPAHVLGLFTLTVTLSCEVDVDVLQILTHPADIIKDYQCSYGVEL